MVYITKELDRVTICGDSLETSCICNNKYVWDNIKTNKLQLYHPTIDTIIINTYHSQIRNILIDEVYKNIYNYLLECNVSINIDIVHNNITILRNEVIEL